jgi:hypothetical protein
MNLIGFKIGRGLEHLWQVGQYGMELWKEEWDEPGDAGMLFPCH